MPDLDLTAIAERYHRALDAKPSKGEITADGIAAITDSVADVPDLLAKVKRLRSLNVRAEALLASYLPEMHQREDELARIRELADWHETKAMKARRYPGSEPKIMAKAASVHDDAARRIRKALDVELDRG